LFSSKKKKRKETKTKTNMKSSLLNSTTESIKLNNLTEENSDHSTSLTKQQVRALFVQQLILSSMEEM